MGSREARPQPNPPECPVTTHTIERLEAIEKKLDELLLRVPPHQHDWIPCHLDSGERRVYICFGCGKQEVGII